MPTIPDSQHKARSLTAYEQTAARHEDDYTSSIQDLTGDRAQYIPSYLRKRSEAVQHTELDDTEYISPQLR